MMTKNSIFQSITDRSKQIYENKFSTKEQRKVTAKKVSDILVSIVKYLLLYGLAFVIIYPLILQLAIGLRTPTDILNPTVLWIPTKYSLKNFEVALIVLDYGKSLFNSIFLSAGVTVLQLLTTALVGYALARLKFPGHKIIFVIVIFTIVVAPTTLEIPLKLNLKDFYGTGLNLMGKPTLLFLFAITGMGIKSGIFIYLFRQFFRGIPIELEESALIDGANPIQIFFRIMMPNAIGGIILTSILTFVWQWNDNYFVPNYVSKIGGNFETLTTKMMAVSKNVQSAIQSAGVWEFFGQNVSENPNFTSMILNTSAILTMIPLIIFYLLVQKKLFTEGVERSGLVG